MPSGKRKSPKRLVYTLVKDNHPFPLAPGLVKIAVDARGHFYAIVRLYTAEEQEAAPTAPE